jgi:hypothetical protein
MLFDRGAAMLRPFYFDGMEQSGAIPIQSGRRE